ncbi:MAG TPA: HAMP domain-containing sensor histidine kinase, partial [Salinisphaeraceae bacterium]|nr:HAMP domain-containing sensor histidine kinase [Salinisphaeraceae bacterium]
MRIRTKIFSSHMALAVTVALFSIVIIATLRVADQHRRHLADSYAQVHNIYLIASEAHHLVEQIAELISIGPQDADIRNSRQILLERLAAQRRLIAEEVETLTSAAQRTAELREIDRIDRIESVIHQLFTAYQRLSEEVAAGRHVVASAIYDSEVENDLDEALDGLLSATIRRESNEMQASFAASKRLLQWSLWLAFGMVVIVVALGIGNMLLLNRTVLRPVTALARAAEAVRRGELSHHVAVAGTDELGNLAQRFNRMTEQIKAQRDALRRTNENLEQQVAERTREVVARSRELGTANARLREVDASRAQFFADISHELRSPLTVLRGQAEVALRRSGTDPVRLRRVLETVVREASQMGRLVQDMLFLARSEAGTITVDKCPTVLQEVIADTLIDSPPMTHDKGIVLAPHQPFEPVIVSGDGDRLRQLMLILLDNAISFAPAESRVAIDLTTTETRASIKVRDSGPGFSRAAAEHAFTRFSQGSASRRRTGGHGIGLGLAIAKWIVDQHTGRIYIEDTAGAG